MVEGLRTSKRTVWGNPRCLCFVLSSSIHSSNGGVGPRWGRHTPSNMGIHIPEAELHELVLKRECIPGVERLQTSYCRYFKRCEAQAQQAWHGQLARKNYEQHVRIEQQVNYGGLVAAAAIQNPTGCADTHRPVAAGCSISFLMTICCSATWHQSPSALKSFRRPQNSRCRSSRTGARAASHACRCQ